MALVPSENPDYDPLATSRSGVVLGQVLSGLNRLFSPSDLERRNALSRSDGYWPFIKDGDEPPLELTYGEFDFYFFSQLLDRALDHTTGTAEKKKWNDKVFVDIGSGAGRLVFAAAALHPTLRNCRGVELLEGLHRSAEESLKKCRVGGTLALLCKDELDEGNPSSLPLAAIDFVCGSFEDPSVFFGDADCIFVTASCLSQDLLRSLRDCILRQCRPGTIVISTDYALPSSDDAPLQSIHSAHQVQVVEQVEGWSWVTGGSTAYIYRVV
jgi:SAM-dependent methyltransferase